MESVKRRVSVMFGVGCLFGVWDLVAVEVKVPPEPLRRRAAGVWGRSPHQPSSLVEG